MTQDEIMEMWNEVIKYAPSEVRITEFAKLVAQHEREACAKVCEDAPEPDGRDLAERIRARGGQA